MNTSPFYIEDILDNCIMAITEQGQTIQDCLAIYPAQREELEPLLKLTLRLQEARTVKASPAFRRESLARVKQQIASHPRRISSPDSNIPGWWITLQQSVQSLLLKPRYSFAMMVLSILFTAFLFTTASLVYFSAQATPKDWLYPAKIVLEETRLTLSKDKLQQANLQLAFADRRLREAVVLSQCDVQLEDVSQNIDLVLEEYMNDLEVVGTLLVQKDGLTVAEQTTLAQWTVVYLNGQKPQLEFLATYGVSSTRLMAKTALATHQTLFNQALEVIVADPSLGSTPTACVTCLTLTPTHTPSSIPTLPNLLPSASPTVPVVVTFTPTPTPVSPYPTLRPTPPVVVPSVTPTPIMLSPTPTFTPTLRRPTLTPTLTPSPPSGSEPGDNPGGWPTEAPTAWPTEAPTTWPTAAPTAWPTAAPTAWPTDAPTAWPTEAPTVWWPTGVPTAWPTLNLPTIWPTPDWPD